MSSNDSKLSAECADYFRQRKAWKRCLEQLRAKWISYGRTAGTIVLPDAAEEERREIGGFLGRSFYDPEIRLKSAEFENALQKTRFAGVSLEELLEAYFGSGLQTNREREDRRREEKERFFEEAGLRLKRIGASSVSGWLHDMQEMKKPGYHVLMTERRKDEKQALAMLEHVGQACARTGEEAEEIPLAVLAARISGNPHYFDRGTPAGSLLICALCWRENCSIPTNAAAWRSLLLESGIAPDQLSNTVVTYGIHLATEAGPHPAFEEFWRLKESCAVTLENLKHITGAWTDSGIVYVVENEMVFSYLLENMKEKKQSLLCTSGQLRTASVRLIGLLTAAGCRIYYSGDLDPEGMTIADRLWRKYPDSLIPWHMSEEDYEHCISEELIDERRLIMLNSLCNPVLQKTAASLKIKKKAGYQENLLDRLTGDLERRICRTNH